MTLTDAPERAFSTLEATAAIASLTALAAPFPQPPRCARSSSRWLWPHCHSAAPPHSHRLRHRSCLTSFPTDRMAGRLADRQRRPSWSVDEASRRSTANLSALRQLLDCTVRARWLTWEGFTCALLWFLSWTSSSISFVPAARQRGPP